MRVGSLPMSTAPRMIEFSREDCKELTSFDRVMFKGFHSVDDDFYPTLFNNGARVIGHRNE